jgi:hypothetical protein
MRSVLLASAALALPLIAAPAARAGDCAGTPGYELVMPAEVAIGKPFTTCITAPGDSFVLVLISASSSDHLTKFGNICVDLPFLTIWGFQMPASGTICLDHPVECDPAVIGFTGHFQAVAIGPTPGVIGLTNGQTLSAVDDGSCGCFGTDPGDYVTYTQGGWGSKCAGSNPGCIRDANFDSVFPSGLLIGDQDGADADTHYSLLLTSSGAVENFLPEGMTPATLDADVVDVKNSSAGVFAGQLVAAKLNVGFDDAGVFDAVKNSDGKLGDLVFIQATNPKLLGFTVNEIIELADKAISGELAEPIDVDNDMVGDVSLSDLSGMLDGLNNNFDDGLVDLEWLCDL